MAPVLIWEPPQTPDTAFNGNVFRYSPVASTDRQPPNTTLPSFNAITAPLPSPLSSFYKTDEERQTERQDETDHDHDHDHFQSFHEIPAEALRKLPPNTTKVKRDNVLDVDKPSAQPPVMSGMPRPLFNSGGAAHHRGADGATPAGRYARERVLLEAKVTKAGPGRDSTSFRAPSSAGSVIDIFADFEKEFGKSPTTLDDQKSRPRLALERHRKAAAGGRAISRGKGNISEQSRDPLQTQEDRPKKRCRRYPTVDNGRSAKRSRSSPPTASSVGRGPLPVKDDNQYAVERLLKCRNRGGVTEYLVKWEGYGHEDNSWVRELDIHPDLINDFALAVTAASS